MEAAYVEKRGHDFEITKKVSVRQVQPLALFALRETGVAEFSLPEVLFDFDFPGHYFHRIKTVDVTIASSQYRSQRGYQYYFDPFGTSVSDPCQGNFWARLFTQNKRGR